MGDSGHQGKNRTEHYTPQYVLDAVIACMGVIDLDPCINSREIPNVPAAISSSINKNKYSTIRSRFSFHNTIKLEFRNKDHMASIFSQDVIQEANEILSILKKTLPKKIDGKEAILELKRIDYNWKQMEWIGWYFEHLLFTTIIETLGGTGGPTFGNTSFDYKKKFVWDFKSHPILTRKGTRNDTMILNDKEAVDLCVQKYHGLGFIVVHGNAVFDKTGEFKAWHDALKGGHSDYEKERIKRDAPSRKRKCAFEIDHIEALFFNNPDDLNRGVSDRWLHFFQEGMRNADGSPRRSKYALKTTKAPGSIHPVDSVRLE